MEKSIDEVVCMEDKNSSCQEGASGSHGGLSRKGKLPEAIHRLEMQMIQEAMERSGGNQRLASEMLGITERMLGYRLKHYGLKFFQ